VTALTTARLGADGPEITRVGLGAWAMGGGDWTHGWGAQDDADSEAAVLRAVELGVGWLDTAPVYGLGHSEEVVGRALRRLPEPDRPLVFSKCGLRWDPADRAAEPWIDLTPASIRAECEDSLRRLGIDHLDVLFVHWPDDRDPRVAEAWQAVVSLVEDGKVRVPGVSNFSIDQLEECQAVAPVGAVQPGFNLLDRDRGGDVIPWCLEHGAGVVVYSPMASGLLTDRFDRARLARLPVGDWRLTDEARHFAEPALTANLALRDALRPIAARHGVTVAEVAIAWTLAWPGVTGAIVGARSPEQVDGWVGGGTIGLTEADLDEIAAAIRATGAGSGPETAIR
jgi:aryl-alcohol dehydrogenase-like predicted oxidoreductase